MKNVKLKSFGEITPSTIVNKYIMNCEYRKSVYIPNDEPRFDIIARDMFGIINDLMHGVETGDININNMAFFDVIEDDISVVRERYAEYLAVKNGQRRLFYLD